MRSFIGYVVLLCLIWGLSSVIVHPVGEFMINDDYAFVTSLETLQNEGRLGSTGKGPAHASGGPSLVTHLAWGWLFTKLFGNSLTVLRFSIIVLGLAGAIGVFLVIRTLRVPDWLCFLASLTLMFNPLYFSQSFSFMTDITFATLIIYSIYFLNTGVINSSLLRVVTGLLLALAGLLTRQLAIIIPAAFILACLITSQGIRFGRIRSLLLTVFLVIIPWLGFEWFLSHIGSTPITKHEKLHDLFSYPAMKGFPDYPLFVLGQLAQSVLGYTAFLVSPLIVLRFGEVLRSRPFVIFMVVITGLFLVLEVATIAGLITPPILLSRNVIYNFGIGPVLLKDSYLLGVRRTWAMPPAIFYILVWWTVLCIGLALIKLYESLSDIFKTVFNKITQPVSFISFISLVAAGGYVLIIVVTDLHDRYVIPLCVLMIFWICSCRPDLGNMTIPKPLKILATAPLIAMMIFSVLGTRDFMEIRRTVTKANYYLTTHLKVKPCDFDGGFEFNGYHCYDAGHEVKPGRSWWWVKNEDYVVALGDLSGYTTVATFPFRRSLGPDGNVHILKPDKNRE